MQGTPWTGHQPVIELTQRDRQLVTLTFTPIANWELPINLTPVNLSPVHHYAAINTHKNITYGRTHAAHHFSLCMT